MAHREPAPSSGLRIVPYEPRHAAAFRDLNLEWIAAYFNVEAEDRRLLEAPEDNILAPGGAILMAELDGEIVGTCALVPIGPQHYELAKMCAAPHARGRGVGKALLRVTIERARAMGATQLTLLSSRRLTTALALYERAGFVEVDDAPGSEHYERCDIAMQMQLDPSAGTALH